MIISISTEKPSIKSHIISRYFMERLGIVGTFLTIKVYVSETHSQHHSGESGEKLKAFSLK